MLNRSGVDHDQDCNRQTDRQTDRRTVKPYSAERPISIKSRA